MNRDFFAGVDPEDAFLDSSNLPGFDTHAAEGKLIQALSPKEVYSVGIIFIFIILLFIYQLFTLQILNGGKYLQLSENNGLAKSIIFAERGIILDRTGIELAWNEPAEEALVDTIGNKLLGTYSLRKYTHIPGSAHLLGFVSYPEVDKSGNWWRTDFIPGGGVEYSFNTLLSGINGNKLIEVDALGEVLSSGSVLLPKNGGILELSIDESINTELYKAIKDGVTKAGFKGGAGVLMDVTTGEVLAITSYPEYDPNILTDGSNRESIVNYNNDSGKPFLNRAVQGTYTPGSIIKPFVGAAALEEGIITEHTKILSTGVLKVPNKYNPGQFSTFRDWRTGLGWLDIRDAIKMSSSIFFYIIGGGHREQEGLGISKISLWADRFGLGKLTGIKLPGEKKGLVPTPEWKKETFGNDSEWNLGNTYHSAIGQYGWLVTPIQAVQYISSVANGGTLHSPTLVKGKVGRQTTVPINDENLQIIREGMRKGAHSGTAQALNVAGITIAAKTGTAQLGTRNQYMNSWVVGFWPYDNPKYAFAVVLEKAKADTLQGAAPAMRPFFEWLVVNHANDYVNGVYPTTK